MYTRERLETVRQCAAGLCDYPVEATALVDVLSGNGSPREANLAFTLMDEAMAERHAA